MVLYPVLVISNPTWKELKSLLKPIVRLLMRTHSTRMLFLESGKWKRRLYEFVAIYFMEIRIRLVALYVTSKNSNSSTVGKIVFCLRLNNNFAIFRHCHTIFWGGPRTKMSKYSEKFFHLCQFVEVLKTVKFSKKKP